MLALAASVCAGAYCGATVTALLRGRLESAARYALRAFFLCCAVVMLDVPNWLAMGLFSALALIFLTIWLRNRPRRKRRLLRLLGHKARAVLAAMKSRMPKISPPVPVSA